MHIFSNIVEVTWKQLFSSNFIENDTRIKYLNIPPYQRTYVWNEYKIKKLLNDIIKSINERKLYYFLGSVILCKEDNSNGESFLIVDGQQRITSLTILFAAIRLISIENKFRKLEEKCLNCIQANENNRTSTKSVNETKYKLNLPDIDNIRYGLEFRWYIQSDGIKDLKKLVIEDNYSKGGINELTIRLQNNLLGLYEILIEMNEEKLDILIDYIENKCKFIVMITEQFLDAHRIFCSINIAGEQLSLLDFYRARFFGYLVRKEGKNDVNRKINLKLKRWNDIFYKLGNSGMSEFVAHVYRISLIESGLREDFINSFTIDDNSFLQVSENNNFDSYEKCESFLETVNEYYKIWEIFFYSAQRTTPFEILKGIQFSYLKVWVTIALATYHYTGPLKCDYWELLEKFITVNIVLNCSKHTTEEFQINDLLDKFFDLILKIKESKKHNLEISINDMNRFIEILSENIHEKLNNYAISYILLRINKSLETKRVIYNIKDIKYCQINTNFEYSGYIGNFIIFNNQNYDEFNNKSWNEKKTNIELVKMFTISENVLKEELWDVNTFGKYQTSYLKIIGKIFDIPKLKDYSFIQNNNQKNVFNIISSNQENLRRLPNDLTLKKAAANLASYLMDPTVSQDGLKKSLKLIDPFGTGILDKDTMLNLLLNLQKKHKLYARRRRTTFEQWIKKHIKNQIWCSYTDLFYDFPIVNMRV